jgi:GAF domain-containing protein
MPLPFARLSLGCLIQHEGGGRMANERVLLQALTEFTGTLVTGYAVSDALIQLSDHAAATLEAAGAGVSFADDTQVLRFATATSNALTAVEREQERLQQGPCMDAFQSRTTVTSDDIERDTRWPDLRPALQTASFRSAAAIPLCSGDTCLGSLNVYHSETRHWNADDLRAAELLAAMATSYVRNASELAQAERTREQLQHALESRVVIEQAKGMIAKANQIPVDRAFQLLRNHARTRNARIHDVARAVVELGLEIH